jgi:cytochrome oxidase assembly protein ShyY1
MVYRFLLSARWLGLAALTVAVVGLMILAGRWQLDRYHERSVTNARIDAARTTSPTPLREVLPAPPGTAGVAGPPAPAAAEWARVGLTGRYDRQREILARGRTVGGQVGFEVLTPLVLVDGAAVLVDRGWTPAAAGGAAARPAVPPAPDGEVTISGRVARSESRTGPLQRVDGRVEVRRIAMGQLAAELPYPVFGSYVLLDSEQPGGGGLTAVPSRRENAWQNAGYVVQWWLFAALTVAAFGWLVRREAAGPPPEQGRDRVGDEHHDRARQPDDRTLTAR